METPAKALMEFDVGAAVCHRLLRVGGRVQGVGFRPFVCRLAERLGLEGLVRNDAQGVTIHVQGPAEALQSFETALQAEVPQQAKISYVERQERDVRTFSGFTIEDSLTQTGNALTTPIPADLAVCPDCLAEFHDPDNRRYHDPFINCSECGPRFSILHALPYDRARSSMRGFTLCAACLEEYRYPESRRFHTQGICCPQCGPEIRLLNAEKQPLEHGIRAVKQVADILRQGGVVAFKGIGGFHLLCDATQPQAVATLRRRKKRRLKPFAVLCKDMQMAQHLAELNEHERQWLTSDARPIVLAKRKRQTVLSADVAPGIERLGLFLAYSPLQHLLFEYIDRPLVATSANLSGEPILFQAEAVFDKLCALGREVVDYVLDHDREIINPCDDSIVQSVNGKTVTLRLARGLAPCYVSLDPPFRPGRLAVGAQQKSTVALDTGGRLVLSPYVADLHSLSALQRFASTVKRMTGLAQCQVNELACDRHPYYPSTQWAQQRAEQQGMPLQKVPHHYAHALACMVEHELTQPVLAFCWDGTGWGEDGTVWGGEVLLADTRQYQRKLHLKPFKLLGGDLANRQPKRVALSLLFERFSLQQVQRLDSPTVKAFSQAEIEQLHSIYLKNLNCPYSSSMGRLLDAVASLLGLVQNLDYEGQSGLLLETLYDHRVAESYPWTISDSRIDSAPVIGRLLRDRKRGVTLERLVSRFFNGLIDLVEEIADRHANLPVVVSGGVWQNQTLLTLLDRRFAKRTQPLYFQQLTPMNDASIALGQLGFRGQESSSDAI